MNNTTTDLAITNVASNVTAIVANVTATIIMNRTSDAFRIIPMSLFTYLSLAVFKLYNSLF